MIYLKSRNQHFTSFKNQPDPKPDSITPTNTDSKTVYKTSFKNINYSKYDYLDNKKDDINNFEKTNYKRNNDLLKEELSKHNNINIFDIIDKKNNREDRYALQSNNTEINEEHNHHEIDRIKHEISALETSNNIYRKKVEEIKAKINKLKHISVSQVKNFNSIFEKETRNLFRSSNITKARLSKKYIN